MQANSSGHHIQVHKEKENFFIACLRPSQNVAVTAKTDTAISTKVVGKNVHATIPKGNMGYDQYTVHDDCSCRTYFWCFPLALENTLPWPFVPILSNFFEEQRTQNHPQCLLGLSHALFPTTFLEIAVYAKKHDARAKLLLCHVKLLLFFLVAASS